MHHSTLGLRIIKKQKKDEMLRSGVESVRFANWDVGFTVQGFRGTRRLLGGNIRGCRVYVAGVRGLRFRLWGLHFKG